jgi:hypothetical protein
MQQKLIFSQNVVRTERFFLMKNQLKLLLAISMGRKLGTDMKQLSMNGNMMLLTQAEMYFLVFQGKT